MQHITLPLRTEKPKRYERNQFEDTGQLLNQVEFNQAKEANSEMSQHSVNCFFTFEAFSNLDGGGWGKKTRAKGHQAART